MLTPFDVNDHAVLYDRYYAAQVGSGFTVYRGKRTMNGNGIGSFLGGLAKAALPVLKRGAKSIGKSLLRTGLDVAGDVLGGENAGVALRKRSRAAGSQLLGDVRGALAGGAPRPPPAKKRRRKKRAAKERDIFG